MKTIFKLYILTTLITLETIMPSFAKEIQITAKSSSLLTSINSKPLIDTRVPS